MNIIVKLLQIKLFQTLIINCIIGVRGDVDKVVFQHEQVESITTDYTIEKVPEIFPLLKRKKLCEAAKEKFVLPYIDPEQVPEIYECELRYKDGDKRVKTVMKCPTLPSIYLRPTATIGRVVATSVDRSITNKFRLNQERIKPKYIELASEQPMSRLMEERLSRLNHENRQNLCLEARKHGVFIFTNDYVPKLHAYEFVYQNVRKIRNAIICPTYPLTYLYYLNPYESGSMISTYGYNTINDSLPEVLLTFIRPIQKIEIFKRVQSRPRDLGNDRGDSSSERENDHINPTLKVTPINDLTESEQLNEKLLSSLDNSDRRRICASAERAINYTINLAQNIDEANFFDFDYGNGLIKKHFVVPCSLEDKMFVSLTNSRDEGALKRILLCESKLLENERRNILSEHEQQKSRRASVEETPVDLKSSDNIVPNEGSSNI